MIKKESYEIIGKETEEDLFPENYSSKSFDAFVASKSTMEEPTDSYYTSVISEVEEDPGVFVVSDHPEEFSDAEDILILSSKESVLPNVLQYDIRYSNIIKDAGKIYVNKNYNSLIDYKNIIENFDKNAHLKSDMYLKTSEAFIPSIKKICENLNLEVIELNKDEQTILNIKKDKDNKCLASILSSDKIYSFNCDIAKTEELKRKGLQGRDYLNKEHGMVFNYKQAQPVMFHMGTVKFPIDILFIDDNNQVKKISKNIEPGTLGTFSCNAVKNVLEISGGFCDKNNISEGDYVLFDKYSGSHNDILFDNFVKSALAVNLSDIIDEKSIKVYSNSNKLLKTAARSSLQIDLGTYITPDDRFIKLNTKKDINIGLLKDSNFDKIIFCHNNLASDNTISVFVKNALDSLGIQKDYDVIRISDNVSEKDVYIALKNKFEVSNVYIYNDTINKSASFNIEKEIKDKSMDVIKIYEKTLYKITRFKKLLNKNKKAFEKIKDKFDVIKSSKGQYNQSIKRLSVKYKYILNDIKKGIQIMNSIKDIQQVEEINNAIITSTKNCSDRVKDVFDMVEDMNSMEFYKDIEKKTDDANKIFEDLSLNIKRMREFIYSNILGKTIISE